MTEISHIFDTKIEDLNADSVLHDNLLNESDYDPEWLLTNTPLLDTSMELLPDVPFTDVGDIKNEIGDVKVEVDDLKDFTDINLRDFADDSGSPEEDFMMPPIELKHSASSGNEDDDDDDDDNKSSSSDASEPRIRSSGLLTPPEDASSYPLSNSVPRSMIQTSGAATLSRPAVAVRPVARHGNVSVNGSTSSAADAAASGGARSSGIRYVVQRQGNPTVYVQANASGRLRPVIPRLKRQETKSSSSLACSDHYYENSGSSEELNSYMVYSPSPPSSSSPDQDDGMVSAAAAAGIYPGHHAYPYASHVVHRSGSNHSTPMFQSPIPQTGVLILTEEEKRTLIAEGYSIPTRLPLTKQEERNLKKIRRKIKNKISAQESRRKKKEYLETLEKKVEAYSHENSELKRRVETLESNNRSLINQLRQLQHLVGKAGSSSASTCLMVFVLFFAAFLAGPGWLSTDLHQMGYAASLPRLPGPPLMPPPRPHALPSTVAPARANIAQTSSGPRGLARFYSEDKLTSRLRQLIMNSPPAMHDEDSPRLLVEEALQQQQQSMDRSFAGRLWCLFGVRCCAGDETAPAEVDDSDPGPVIVVGNRTEDFGVSMVVLASRSRSRGVNATVV